MAQLMSDDVPEKLPESINVISPCIGVCELDEAEELCMGCRRTVREIGAWRYADLRAKAQILCRAFLRWRAAGAPDPEDSFAVLNHGEMAERFRLMGLME